MARRGGSLANTDDPRLTLLFEAEGVRNQFQFNTYRGPFPMPRRAAFALFQILDDDGHPTGATELVSHWLYDNHAQALHGREMLEYSRTRWHAMITERLGAAGGLGRLFAGAAASSLFGIDINALESAIDQLQLHAEGDQLQIRAALTPTQVRALLNAIAMGQTQAREE